MSQTERWESLGGTYHVSFLCSFQLLPETGCWTRWIYPLTWYGFSFFVLVRHIHFINSNAISLLPTLASLLSHPSAISCLWDCQQRWTFIMCPDGTLHSWGQAGVTKGFHNIAIIKKWCRNIGGCRFISFCCPLGFVTVIWLLLPKSN